MFDFVIKVIFWIFCIYGLLSVIHDFINYNTYKKVNENIKLILFVKNVEDGIEQYIKELAFGGNFFNNLIVIDENSNDDTYAILHNLECNSYNMKVMNKEEGKEYLNHILWNKCKKCWKKYEM